MLEPRQIFISEKLAQELFANGQVYSQYCTEDGKPTMLEPENPNGSPFAIEGLTSPEGLVLGTSTKRLRGRFIDREGRLPLTPNAMVSTGSATAFSATPSSGETPQRPLFFDKTPKKCHFDTFAKIVKMLFFEHEYIGSVVPSWRRKNSWKRN